MNRNNQSSRAADFEYATQMPRRLPTTPTREQVEHGKSSLLMLGCFLAVLIVASEVAKYHHWFI